MNPESRDFPDAQLRVCALVLRTIHDAQLRIVE
jgi:hypothetical protein